MADFDSLARPWTVFVTGTDTEVGKTHVSSLAVANWVQQGLSVGVYKPVASGCRREGEDLISDDAESLWHAAGQPQSLAAVCPQRFVAPLAPPEAAALEGQQVDERKLLAGADGWTGYDRLLVEGAGGLMSPISQSWLNLHLIQQLSPDRVVLVAADRLGVIHQVLSTIAAANHGGVSIDRVVLSRTDPDSDLSVKKNADQIRGWTDVLIEDAIEFGQVDYSADW